MEQPTNAPEPAKPSHGTPGPGGSTARLAALGAVAFTLPSLLVFGSWAWGGRFFYRNLGEAGAYAAWAFMFIGLAAFLMPRALAPEGTRGRFALAFSLGFLLYSFLWSLAWMKISNRPGEWIGSAAGTAGYIWVMRCFFASERSFVKEWSLLFLLHSAGYFAGSLIFEALKHSTLSMMAWGLTYGLGMGAGMGAAFRPKPKAETQNPNPSPST
ncbi:MAG: hypothetical protein FJ405_10765 [Verrucomicrobia bacterium]|nr:hypothetical protein [Verrucomicrobiota bacterium]